jgi:hypothetical protein
MSRRISQGALVIGSIGVLINIVDAIGSGHLEPHDAFAALVALGAGGELLKERRPSTARARPMTGSTSHSGFWSCSTLPLTRASCWRACPAGRRSVVELPTSSASRTGTGPDFGGNRSIFAVTGQPGTDRLGRIVLSRL